MQVRIVAGLWLAVAVIGSGCTTLQTTQLPPDELQDGIRNGSLVQSGDEVDVVLADGTEQVFDVREVDGEVIRGTRKAGGEVTIAIDDVLALRTHQNDEVRSTFAVLGGIGAAGMVVPFVLLLLFAAL